MSNNVPWYRSPKIMVPAITVILAAIIGAYFTFYFNPPDRDFELSINPMQGTAEPGGVITTQVTVQGINGYKHPVSLSASQHISDVLVTFVPPLGGATPSFTSNVNIRIDESVPIGTYEIEIKGLGADGTSHTAIYILNVMPEAPTSTLTSTPSPTLTSVTNLQMTDAFYPSGWMGDYGDIKYDDSTSNNPHSPPTSIKISYTAAVSQGYGWAGIYWQYPDKNWGDKQEGRDLSKYSKITFWARGEKGGEKAEFKVGGIEGKYPDSIQPAVSTGIVVLTPEWKKFSIDLSGKDRSHVVGGFVWVTNKNQNPVGSVIYLDDIQYE